MTIRSKVSEGVTAWRLQDAAERIFSLAPGVREDMRYHLGRECTKSVLTEDMQAGERTLDIWEEYSDIQVRTSITATVTNDGYRIVSGKREVFPDASTRVHVTGVYPPQGGLPSLAVRSLTAAVREAGVIERQDPAAPPFIDIAGSTSV